MMTDKTRREIVTHEEPKDHPPIFYTDDVGTRGEIERVGRPENEAAEAKRRQDDLHDAIAALEPLIGFRHMDRLLTGLNGVVMATRSEVIARMVAAATAMVDYPLGILVTPEAEEEDEAP